jgi:hypothetical protein
MRRFKKQHRVAVYDTRPLPDEPDPYEPYFIAICDCGWVGAPHDTSEPASAEAYDHSPDHVTEELVPSVDGPAWGRTGAPDA